MRIVLLGPPGSGKGTHGKRLAAALGSPVISTGDILRQAISEGTQLGKAAQADVQAGRLVADATVLGLIETRLARPDAVKGFILDGFPRTTVQAEGLARLLGDRKLDYVLNLVVGDETIVERLESRWLCPECGAIYNAKTAPPAKEGICDRCESVLSQRSDDRPDTVRARLKVYATETAPLVAHYQRNGVLRNIDASGTADDVYAAVEKAIGRVAA